MAAFERVLAWISPRWRTPAPCEGCGEPFTCGATIAGCWCTTVAVDRDTRASLRQRYRTCICKSCLERESRLGNSSPK